MFARDFRFRAAFWLTAMMIFAASPGLACSCGIGLSGAPSDQELLDRADIVVRGVFLEFHVDRNPIFTDRPFPVGTFLVKETLKGKVPLGEVSIATGFRTGDCGIAGFMLASIARERNVDLQITEVEIPSPDDFPTNAPYPIFYTDMCGYARMANSSEQEEPTNER